MDWGMWKQQVKPMCACARVCACVECAHQSTAHTPVMKLWMKDVEIFLHFQMFLWAVSGTYISPSARFISPKKPTDAPVVSRTDWSSMLFSPLSLGVRVLAWTRIFTLPEITRLSYFLTISNKQVTIKRKSSCFKAPLFPRGGGTNPNCWDCPEKTPAKIKRRGL